MAEAHVGKLPAGTKHCVVCAEPINKGAKKCIHCQADQNWLRRLPISSTVLSLLVALVSVIAAASPAIKELVTPKNSVLIFTIVNSQYGELQGLISNTGNRTGVLLGVAITSKGSRVMANPATKEQVVVVEPGKTILVTFKHYEDRPYTPKPDELCAVTFEGRDYHGASYIVTQRPPCNDIDGYIENLMRPRVPNWPRIYSKEISKLSDGVNALSSAYSTGLASLAADRDAKAQFDILHARGSGGKVTLSSSCFASRPTEPCLLYLQGTSPPMLTTAEQLRNSTQEALKVLKNYVNALAAVANAVDQSAYDTEVGQLLGAVGTIMTPADAVAPGVSPTLQRRADAAGVNIFGRLVGTTFDEQRYDTFKQVLTIVGLPVQSEALSERSAFRLVARTLGLGLDAIKSVRQEIIDSEIRTMVNGLNLGILSEEDYRKQLAEAQAAQAAATALRKSDPEGVARDLADAHDKLVMAIVDPRKNYAAFKKAVGDFADKAATMEAALTALTSVTTAKTTTAKKEL